MFRFICLTVTTFVVFEALTAQGPQQFLGIFSGQSEVGTVLRLGAGKYNAANDAYTVSGSGENMWFANDDFHFVWKKVSARDLTISATISILGDGGNAHRKAFLMMRQSLDSNSAYVDAARHGEGLTSLQYRDTKGATTREIESAISGPSKLRLEKQGDQFYLWIASGNENLQFSGGSARVHLQAPFYVGIGVCSHDKNAIEKAVFSTVDLDMSPPHHKAVYSTIETALLSGDARVGYVSQEHLTSPGWSTDGQKLTYQLDDRVQETPFLPLRTAAPVGAPGAIQPNPKYLYFTSEQGGGMQIWRKLSDGSQAEQITSDSWNNSSPNLSPDSKYLLFLSFARDMRMVSENQEVTLRLENLTDKTVKTLVTFTGGPSSLGAQPWSPDGRRVVFISYQTMN